MGHPRLSTTPYRLVRPDGIVELDSGQFVVAVELSHWPDGVTWPQDCVVYHHAIKVPTPKPGPRPGVDPFALALEHEYLADLRQPFRILSVLSLVSRDVDRLATAARYLATASAGQVLGPHEVCQWLGTLCNLRESQVAAPAGGNLRGYLYEQEVGLARRHVELRRASHTLVAVASLSGLPEDTGGEAFEHLARLRRTFAVIQSFRPQLQTQALAELRTRQRRLQLAQSEATSLRDEADELLGDLVTERVVCGTHSLTIHIAASGGDQLAIAVAEVRSVLNARGFALTEESLGLAPAYVSAFHRPDLAPRRTQVTTANLGDMAITPTVIHASAAGGAHEWGYLTTLLTRRGELHPLTLHVGDVGHTAVIGPTGEGKSVFLSFLATQARLRDVRIFWIDKDQGARATVAALGAPYHLLEHGRPLGNPLALDDLPEVRDWLHMFLSSETNAIPELIDEAIDALYELPADERSFDDVATFLAAAGVEVERLKRWCMGGRLHHTFTPPRDFGGDSDVYPAHPARAGQLPPVIGYDFTGLLRADYATVALSYLFLRFELALRAHGRYLLMVDEAWLAFADKDVSAYLENYIRTIRKFGGAMIVATQSARDVAGALAGVIREQCASIICFRCLQADDDAYGQLGLLPEQTDEIRRLARRREFLLVQGNESLVLQCDMSHIPKFLDVFAARDQFDRERETFIGEAASRV